MSRSFSRAERAWSRCDLPCRRGAAIAEFAIVLPIFFLCFTSMIEISRILLLQNSADTAAYEGARNAMVPGAKSSEAKSAAKALLTAAGLRNCDVKVSPDLITEDTPLIVVLVEVPVASNCWITPFWFMPKSVSSQVVLVCERPPAVQLTALPKLKEIDNAIQLGLGSATLLSIGNQTSSSSLLSVGLNNSTAGLQAAGIQAAIPLSNASSNGATSADPEL